MREKSHINSFVSMVYNRFPISRFRFPGRVSLIYVGDLVGGLVSCIDNARVIGKTYFAATESQSIGDLFKIILTKITDHAPRQLPVPKMVERCVQRFHSRMPLTVANLFVDYLYADGTDFVKDFYLGAPTLFFSGVDEVIASNTSLMRQVMLYKAAGFGFFGALLKHSLYPMAFFKKHLPSYGTILDFGCGEGMLTNLLAQTLGGVEFVGIDKDPDRIASAQKTASQNATFLCQSIESCSYSQVQAVVINDVLHHHTAEKQEKIITKAISCLAPGGVLVLKEVDANDRPDASWTTFWDRKLYPKDALFFRKPEAWHSLLASLGFSLAHTYRVKHFWPASRTIFVYAKHLL